MTETLYVWCRYVVIASGCASCPKLTCERPGCGTLFCYHCKQMWHPNQTCDAARAERLANTRASFSCSQESSSHSSSSLIAAFCCVTCFSVCYLLTTFHSFQCFGTVDKQQAAHPTYRKISASAIFRGYALGFI